MPDHSVALVVDRTFGERLLPLAQRLHVWVCDTPINDAAAEEAGAAIPPGAVWNEVGVTTFRAGPNDTPEEMVIGRILDIDEHHPNWTQVEVYGVWLTDDVRAAWQEYRADEFWETPEGFCCSRPLSENPISAV